MRRRAPQFGSTSAPATLELRVESNLLRSIKTSSSIQLRTAMLWVSTRVRATCYGKPRPTRVATRRAHWLSKERSSQAERAVATERTATYPHTCLLYTSDAADER